MVLDLIFVSILVLMVALGAWRGAVLTGTGLLSLIAGYGGALFAATHWTGWTVRTLVISPIVAPAVAGTLGFLITWLVVSSVAGVLVAWDRARLEEEGGRSPIDRAFGGFFGLARGSLIVVLFAILASWLDAARDLGTLDGFAGVPDAQGSAIASASGNLVENAVASALSDAGPAGEVAARLVGRPGDSLASVQTILEDERLVSMFEDRLFWTLIQNDSIDHAMNRSAVRSIVYDAEMRSRFVDLGLVDPSAREDPKVFRAAMADVLSEVAPKVQRLQHDPEMKALAQDPEIIALVESGNTVALMTHPRIQRLVSKLSQEL